MKKCSTCGTEVTDDAKSCPTCGGPVGDPVISANGTQKSETAAPEPPKKKHTGLKVIAIIAGIIIAISVIASCSYSCSQQANSTKEDWPTGPLAQMIPSMDRKCEWVSESKDSLSIDVVDRVNKSDYDSYVNECKQWGYTIEVEEDSDDYKAFNAEGYELEIDFRDFSGKEISIHLYAPKANGNLVWPTKGLATKIPNPNKTKGKIINDSAKQFDAYVGEMDKNAYNAYVEKCIEAGFNVDYDKGDEVFTADNKTGDSLRIQYEGFNTISISIDVAESSSSSSSSSSTSSSSSSSSTSSNSSSSSAAPSSSFKQTMDEYEKFIDSYVAFMKKYNSSSNTASLASDYAKFMSDYASVMEKIEAIDEDSLSSADYAYYSEVMARVAKKLADASLS